MAPIFESRRLRLGLTIAVLMAALILVACDPPTEFPEPLNDTACWELVIQQPDVDLPAGMTPGQSAWDWDGESDTATYYSYGCQDTPDFPSSSENPFSGADAELSAANVTDMPGGQQLCGYQAYTYNRICEIPVEEPVEPEEPEEPVIFACNVDDGSLNAYHCGRPVAIYRGSFVVWGIDPATGEGELAFQITSEQIAAAGIPEAEPVLIAEGINPFTQAAIHVFRLPTGDFQLNTWYVGGKPYAVKWAEGDTFVTDLLW